MQIALIKKAEIHCHLDGLHHPVMQKYLPVTSKEDWIDRFCAAVYPLPGENYYDTLLQMLIEYVKLQIEQNVDYFEIMTSSMLRPDADDMSLVIQNYERFRETIDTKFASQINVEFLVGVSRKPGLRLDRQIDQIIELYKRSLIRGIAFAAFEEPSIKSMSSYINRIQDTGMGLEIHCGEWTGPDNIWDAILHSKVDRIGHALSAFKDPDLLEEIKKRDIHIEFCPTSNVKVGQLNELSEHPIAKALELRMNFSINTDDPGPFETSINREFQLVSDHFGFTKEDFEFVYHNTRKSSFENR